MTNNLQVQISGKDIEQITAKGLTVEQVLSQIKTFVNEIPYITLREPARLGSGIVKLDTNELLDLAKSYEQKLKKLEVVKFVPASGAASRMFKDLFKFLDSYDYSKESINSYLNYEKAVAIRLFLIGFEKPFDISYSFQEPSTDTIAVTEDNKPFRLADGSILFRPGGHGALIENLNAVDADVVFVKNIDNVVVRKYQDELTVYKKALAGKLLMIQNQVF